VEQRNLTEDEVRQIDVGYENSTLDRRSKLAIAFADAFLDAQGEPDETTRLAMREEFSPAEIAELAIGLALFHGFSKMLIISGCEPEEMDTTILSVPGSPGRA